MNDREMYRLTGSEEHRRPNSGIPDRYLKVMQEGGPIADDLTNEQFAEAVQRIHEDTSGYPQFPWPSLADIAGPMCPEDLIMVAARTGGGKSLFLQNVWDYLICTGRFGLYIGLEQRASELRVKWSCLRQDVPPKLVLAPKPGEQGSPQWRTAMELVQSDLKWQKSPDVKMRAHFAPARQINAKGLKTWVEWGMEHGAEFVIVDHIDRIAHGDGRNSFQEISDTVRMAKELANANRIVMLVATQVGRPSDKLEQFMPPTLHDLRGAGTKEEESNTVLGVYRPLRPGITVAEMTAVRQGLAGRESIIEPNVMGVQILKHRLDGPMTGAIAKLSVHHQRVREMADRDSWIANRREGIY